MRSVPTARYKDLCIDTTNVEISEVFWSQALGLARTGVGDDSRLIGPAPQHTVWINTVAEPKTVKNRVHIDVHTDSLDTLQALGATVVEHFERWTVLADPDGQEFCAFLRDAPPSYRLYEIVVDCRESLTIARWWAHMFGARLTEGDEGDWWWVGEIPGCPIEGFAFVPVPEPKTIKNRVHWDVMVSSVTDLLDAGATLLRRRDDEIRWHVLADPEGNEFCAFEE
jgi:hypothetical protein